MMPSTFAASATPIVSERIAAKARPHFRRAFVFYGGAMLLVTLIGTGAAIASTMSFAPQAWKIIKTAETKDISAGMYLITVTAFALWTVYGVILNQWPLVVSNVICFFLSGFILLMKFLPRSRKQQISRSIDERLR
jgi:MtN3 and saliva related transmembrane protein